MVDPAHVSGGDWMRFDSNRLMAWDALGDSARTNDSPRQRHWRSSECNHAPRFSITSRRADRGSDDLLPGPLHGQTLSSLNAERSVVAVGVLSRNTCGVCVWGHARLHITPLADFRARDEARETSRRVP